MEKAAEESNARGRRGSWSGQSVLSAMMTHSKGSSVSSPLPLRALQKVGEWVLCQKPSSGHLPLPQLTVLFGKAYKSKKIVPFLSPLSYESC